MRVPANSPEIRLLRIAMMDQQLTGPALAERTGLSLSAIEKFMAGHCWPSKPSIAKIEKAMGIAIWTWQPREAVARIVTPEIIAAQEFRKDGRAAVSTL